MCKSYNAERKQCKLNCLHLRWRKAKNVFIRKGLLRSALAAAHKTYIEMFTWRVITDIPLLDPNFKEVKMNNSIKCALFILFMTTISFTSYGHDELVVDQKVDKYLTKELLSFFDLILLVDKAEKGPTAQTMRVIQKQSDGYWNQIDSFSVSTGTEKYRKSPSGRRYHLTTPSGIFQLDLGRMFPGMKGRYSSTWKEYLPWMIFFDYQYANKRNKPGRKSGLGIHGLPVTKDGRELGREKLGTRASGGCIRVPTDKWAEIHQMIDENYKGKVPLFKFDKSQRTTTKTGQLIRNRRRQVKTKQGLRVLLIVINSSQKCFLDNQRKCK